MRPEPDPSPMRAHVVVTAHDWRCVQRVVGLLTARSYVVDALTAAPASGAPYWRVGIVLRCDPTALQLLQARLERIPDVTDVVACAGTDALGRQERVDPSGA